MQLVHGAQPPLPAQQIAGLCMPAIKAVPLLTRDQNLPDHDVIMFRYDGLEFQVHRSRCMSQCNHSSMFAWVLSASSANGGACSTATIPSRYATDDMCCYMYVPTAGCWEQLRVH